MRKRFSSFAAATVSILQATWAHVALAWNINRGVAVVPRSTADAHIAENFEALARAPDIDASGLPPTGDESPPQNSELAQLAKML